MFYKLLVLLCAVYLGSMASTSCDPKQDDIDDRCLDAFTTIEDEKIKSNSGSSEEGVKPNYELNPTIVEAINKQIRIELAAHYIYLSMSYHFDQASHYLPGFHKFFKKMSAEDHEHAQKFMKYLNKREGKIGLYNILTTCNVSKWENGTMAMKIAFKVEKCVYEKLCNLHSTENGDAQFRYFVESEFLAEQIDSIKEISNHVHVLGKLNSTLGEYQFDKLTLGGEKEE